jgi:hypothetical protein
MQSRIFALLKTRQIDDHSCAVGSEAGRMSDNNKGVLSFKVSLTPGIGVD